MSCSHAVPGRATRTLIAGELYCARRTELLGTILGSCVAVCLWDKRERFGGMNHFLLPTRPANAEASARYGDVAIASLLGSMLELGSRPEDLQAKVFGGACVLRTGNSELAVGRRNVEVAMEELLRHGIPVVASRVSGGEGVAILNCTECGDVWVRRISGPVPQPKALSRIRTLHWPADRLLDQSHLAEGVRFPPALTLGEAEPAAVAGGVAIGGAAIGTPASAAAACNTCGTPPLNRRSR
jgi:chemotaxis protein CheD